MADHEHTEPEEPTEPGPRAEPADSTPARARRFPRAWRGLRWFGLVLLAFAAGLVVALSLVDLGPRVKPLAESQAGRLIQRPVRIGHLSMSPLRGRFVFDDLTIENVDPLRTPFFHARRIVVTMPWWTVLLRREVFIESVVVSDWQMRIEAYAEGGHNFIKIPRPGPGPRRFVTTVQLVRAERGEFAYYDYRTPWSLVAREADVTLAKLRDYRGEMRLRNGTVQIQRYEPMWLNGYGTFSIIGGKVVVDRVDFDSDGARSSATGVVDVGAWPEQTYQVKSELDFSRMRELFFAGYDFSLFGKGRFEGSFHLFKGGRELAGDFSSAEAGLNDWRLPRLKGKVLWTSDRLEVTETTSDFYGGALRLTYTMKPLGQPRPTIARLDTSYEGVELTTLTDFLARPSLRLAGLASGRTRLEFPLGRFREHRGDGELSVTPPGGVDLMTRTPPAGGAEAWPGPPVGPFNPEPLLGYLPVGGHATYRYGPEWIEVSPSEMATPLTFVAFEGRTRYGEDSTFPFHVTSHDWQESDRVLAAIISAFGQQTRAVPVGGSGEFDGVMSGSFTRPLVTGRFTADRVWAWNVAWGQASGDVTIFNSYVDVKNGRLRSGAAEASAEGRFSLGYPRRDGGEEFDARVQLRDWPLADLRLAFELYDYPVDGLVSGEFHLYDFYTGPQGFGRATFRDIVAYGESFEAGATGLRFEGNGVRLDGFEVRKGGGDITGAAFVGWDGTYSFNATGRRIPVERVAALTFPQAPFTGQLQFTAAGSGVFLSPRYEVKLRVDDLFLRDEGVGQVTGRLLIRDDIVTVDQFEVASARLAVSGRGRVALTDEADGELVLRFQETSLDPYVRALQPQLSPFTTAVASGTLRVFGELNNPERVQGDVVVDALALNLFDYRLRNDGDLRFSLDNQVVRVDRLRLVGDGTAVEMAGEVRLADEQIALRALGDANLGILQGFLRDIRSSGAAEVQADIRGRLDSPTVLGALVINNGRLRHFALPHAFEAINGRVEFDAAGLRIDALSGRLGGGPVRLNGRLGFRGFTPTEYNLTAVGEGLRLRYPEGFRSLIDAELTLRGDFFNPLLGGTVTVRSATLERTFDTGGGGLFGFGAGGGDRPATPPVPSRIPVRFDIRLLAPSSLRVENRDARLVSSAELTLRGTYDQPILFGRVEVDRGEVLFEGNRYQVTRGTVDFVNPTRIEPLFDVEAETQARVPGQIYRVVTRVTGTPARFSFDLSSDPPLPTVEILSLLFGQVRDPQNAELRALRSPQQAEQELIKARAARLLASPIASEVGRVVEETFGVDSVQITPLLSDMSAQESSRITPSARLTVGKRVSDRVYLTYSRALNASTRDEIILLEFTQSDRLAWIVSQNEDRTYAVDVRVRRVF